VQPTPRADNSAVLVLSNVKVRMKPSIPGPSESSWLVMVKFYLLGIEVFIIIIKYLVARDETLA
jgi:hypothetical protein